MKTFSAHGVFGMSVIVSVVAENTSRVIDIQDITPDMIEKQIDAVFEDIETSLTSMEILGLASSMMDYELVDTHGFPFELTTGSYGSKGDLVVAADLETNVSELHEYLFGTKDYVPTKVVQGISQKVKNDTGVTAESAVRMDNPLTVIGDEEDSESSASDDKNSK